VVPSVHITYTHMPQYMPLGLSLPSVVVYSPLNVSIFIRRISHRTSIAIFHNTLGVSSLKLDIPRHLSTCRRLKLFNCLDGD